MTAICFYFQVHQPFRLQQYSYFDVDRHHHYYDVDANCRIMRKVAGKCYLPTTKMLYQLIKQYQGKFRVAFSISGTAIEQFKAYSPETLEAFQRLVDTGCVELINETYYHSLSFLYSLDEFKAQVKLHRELIQREFGVTPTTFRNTELIYNNQLAAAVEDLGFNAILAEGADKVLAWRSSHFVYQPQLCSRLKLLLRSYKLSDDIAFRFSNKQWSQHPLSAERYSQWLHAHACNSDVINLFMDFETFGEHQWADTGIFDFLRALPEYALMHPDFYFATPAEIVQQFQPAGKLDVDEFFSWADTERDLTAWRGNELQNDSLQTIYQLESQVKAANDLELTKTWRGLQTSDHFYYMCTKWFQDGDVHKYFNHFGSPYDAYISYQGILNDFRKVLQSWSRLNFC